MATNSDTRTCIPLRDNPSGQGLMLATIALLAMGVIMVHSAMVRPVSRNVEWYSRVDMRHTLFAVVAMLVLAVAWRFDYRRFNSKNFPSLAAIALGVSLLMAVLVFIPGIGHAVGGKARFIRIGPAQYSMGFQPSELIKFALLIFLAAWLGRESVNVRSFTRTFVPALAVIGISVGAIVTEDFSVGAVTGIVAIVTLILAGVPWYYNLVLLPPAALGIHKFVLTDPYRWNRVLAWLDPWSQTNDSAYQVRESLLAIITGGWTGKGLGLGTVKQGHLPESSTDFIFSIYCEEWGFFGAVLLLGIIFFWTWHARKAAARASDKMGMLLAGSLGFLIAMQAVLHIAVALVTAPTTGMGLPFISAGGTALVISTAAVAIIISVSARGKTHQELLAEAGTAEDGRKKQGAGSKKQKAAA